MKLRFCMRFPILLEIAVTCLCILAGSYQVWDRFQNYLDRQVITETSNQAFSEFPSVMICPSLDITNQLIVRGYRNLCKRHSSDCDQHLDTLHIRVVHELLLNISTPIDEILSEITMNVSDIIQDVYQSSRSSTLNSNESLINFSIYDSCKITHNGLFGICATCQVQKSTIPMRVTFILTEFDLKRFSYFNDEDKDEDIDFKPLNNLIRWGKVYVHQKNDPILFSGDKFGTLESRQIEFEPNKTSVYTVTYTKHEYEPNTIMNGPKACEKNVTFADCALKVCCTNTQNMSITGLLESIEFSNGICSSFTSPCRNKYKPFCTDFNGLMDNEDLSCFVTPEESVADIYRTETCQKPCSFIRFLLRKRTDKHSNETRVEIHFIDKEAGVSREVWNDSIILLFCDAGGLLGLWLGISVLQTYFAVFKTCSNAFQRYRTKKNSKLFTKVQKNNKN